MRMRFTARLLELVLIFAFIGPSTAVLTGCGGQPATVDTPAVSPRQQFFTNYMAALESANVIYKETFIAIGRAKKAGRVTLEQEARAVELGHKIRAAIEAGKDALHVYVRATEPGAQFKVFSVIGDVNRLMAELSKIIGGAQ